MKGLRKQGDFTPQGIYDISNEAVACGLRERGLRGLTALLLGTNLRKTEQMSRWDKPNLSEAQQRYAAYDALIALPLHAALHALDVPALKRAHQERTKARARRQKLFLDSRAELLAEAANDANV
jgi:ribonuclease D